MRNQEDSFQERVIALIDECDVRGSDNSVQVLKNAPSGHLYLQVSKLANRVNMAGRKWLLSPHMTDSELVQTYFKALLTWHEHELREAFTYKGAKVFSPHLDLEELAGMLKDGMLEEVFRAHERVS